MAIATNQRQQQNTQEPPLLLAFELGLKTWKLSFARDFRDTPGCARLPVVLSK